MSEASSDTTHEAILHNVVSHVLNLRQQVTQVQTDIQTLQVKLDQIQATLQQLVLLHESSVSPLVDQKEQQQDR